LRTVAGRVSSKHRIEVDAVRPPDLRTLGSLPFTQKEREALRVWLSEDGWPRDSMDIETLEGYLVALLVWPVGLHSGAWLPTIWGERGWKVPAKLALGDALNRFVALLGGFLQALDHGLISHSIQCDLVMRAPETKRRWQQPPACLWAAGFMTALAQHSQGLTYRSSATKAAAETIARCAFTSSPSATGAELVRAVLNLADERTSRGPLGPLETVERPAVVSRTAETRA
jgi:yecA family protein